MFLKNSLEEQKIFLRKKRKRNYFPMEAITVIVFTEPKLEMNLKQFDVNRLETFIVKERETT